MCELYLHAAPRPLAHHPWLGDFLSHAGEPWTNRQGWGVAAFSDDGACRDATTFREPVSADVSELAAFVAESPPTTHLLIGHIRAASSGGVSLANTQPLSRVVGAARIVFAHNGSVAEFMDSAEGRQLQTRAVGSADSEIAFLRFVDFMDDRPLARCIGDFHRFAVDMAAIGPFNVIISDGDDTLVHSDIRKHASDPEDADFRGPGLYSQATPTGGLVFSSEPLADDHTPVPKGTSLHIRHGAVVSSYD